MNKEELQTIIEAMDKGFRADSTATLGESVRDAKSYLDDMSEAKDVI